jgi:hypothetical protein
MKIFLKQNSNVLKRFKASHSDHSQSSSVRDMSGEVSTVAGPSSGPVIGLTERTDALVRGFVFLLEHHGAPSRVTCQLKEQLHNYLDTSDAEGVWLNRAKYVMTYPLAKFLRNELPPSPGVVFRPTGALRRWMKARLNAFCRKNVHLWYSWLQVKRCALSVSDTMVAAAYEKHFKQLTMPDPCSESSVGFDLLDQIFDNPAFRKVLTQIRSGVGRCFENNFSERVASTSACFEASRKADGQYGALREFLPGLKDFLAYDEQPPVDLEKNANSTYVGYAPNLEAVVQTEDEIPYDLVPDFSAVEYRGGSLLWIGGDELVRMEERNTVRGGHTERVVLERYERYGRIWWNMLTKVRDSRLITTKANLNATIQAVLEPLKIRIISKGPAFEYYEMKPLQKAIHGVMRTMPCFRLIGRPLCPTDLMDCVRNIIHEDDMWHSIDYSAATDGLSSEYGMRILEFILRDVPLEERIKAGKVLGPHLLHYPELRSDGTWSAKGKARGCQTNGQLMGGILSFPILCLANLGVYLHVRRENGRLTEDSLNEVLVNGDDMLYIGKQSEWDLHKTVGKAVGLEMSVGKAYRHRAYANANSTSFVMDLDRYLPQEFGGALLTPYQINFLNVGLVFGQHKVQAREAGTAESHHVTAGCVPNIPVILDGCLPGRQSEVLRYILMNRRKEVREDSRALIIQGKRRYEVCRNLFLPCSQGGMGLTAPQDWQYRVKKIDRRIAASLETEVPRSCFPLPGFPVESDTDPIPPWIRKQPEPSIPEYRLCQGRTRHIPLVPVAPYWFGRGVVLI